VSGVWEGIPEQKFIFSDGTTTQPPDLPPVNVDGNMIGMEATSIGYTLMAVMLLFGVVCFMWTIVFGNEPVVIASQPIFLFMVFGSHRHGSYGRTHWNGGTHLSRDLGQGLYGSAMALRYWIPLGL